MTSKTEYPYLELNRFVCAAVCSQRLTDLLLTNNPQGALDLYRQLAPMRALSIRERDLILSIRDARDICDFAAKLYAATTIALARDPPT